MQGYISPKTCPQKNSAEITGNPFLVSFKASCAGIASSMQRPWMAVP